MLPFATADLGVRWFEDRSKKLWYNFVRGTGYRDAVHREFYDWLCEKGLRSTIDVIVAAPMPVLLDLVLPLFEEQCEICFCVYVEASVLLGRQSKALSMVTERARVEQRLALVPVVESGIGRCVEDWIWVLVFRTREQRQRLTCSSSQLLGIDASYQFERMCSRFTASV